MSALNIFIIQIEYTAQKIRQTLSQPKPWCNDSGAHVEFTPRLLHHDNDVKEVVSSQPSTTWFKSANQKIGIRTLFESLVIIHDTPLNYLELFLFLLFFRVVFRSSTCSFLR